MKKNLLILTVLILLSGCSLNSSPNLESLMTPSEIEDGKDQTKTTEEHGVIYKFFNPGYADSWNPVVRVLYFIGPGH